MGRKNSSVHQKTQFTRFQIFYQRKSVSIFDSLKAEVNIQRANNYWDDFLQLEKSYLNQTRYNICQQQKQHAKQ